MFVKKPNILTLSGDLLERKANISFRIMNTRIKHLKVKEKINRIKLFKYQLNASYPTILDNFNQLNGSAKVE